MAPDLPALQAQARQLETAYRSGQDPRAFEGFADLASLLLRVTVLRLGGAVRIYKGEEAGTRLLSGWTLGAPLLLNNDRFLRLHMSLYIDEARLKVGSTNYQYQLDQAGDQWVFRYEFLRTEQGPRPPAHLQVRGHLQEASCLPPAKPLGRVHFPTFRVSLEAVIRLLADEFHVGCNEPEDVWRPLLAETEAAFYEIAHRAVPPAPSEW